MSKKKYRVRAECPSCACGDVSFLGPEKLQEKFIGDEVMAIFAAPVAQENDPESDIRTAL